MALVGIPRRRPTLLARSSADAELLLMVITTMLIENVLDMVAIVSPTIAWAVEFTTHAILARARNTLVHDLSEACRCHGRAGVVVRRLFIFCTP